MKRERKKERKKSPTTTTKRIFSVFLVNGVDCAKETDRDGCLVLVVDLKQLHHHLKLSPLSFLSSDLATTGDDDE